MSVEQRDQGPRPDDAVLAALCHRVRTPLHGVLGALELLADGDLDDGQRELVRAAREAAVELHNAFESALPQGSSIR